MRTILALVLLAGAQPAFGGSLPPLTDKKTSELFECYISQAKTYAGSSCDPADVLADATLGKCLPEKTKMEDAYAKDFGFPISQEYISSLRRSAKPGLMSAVLDERIRLHICAPKAN
jgi:hypothetical protein